MDLCGYLSETTKETELMYLILSKTTAPKLKN